MPDATDSYVPVSHYHLSEKLLAMSTDILRDYAFVGEKYAIARQGNQLFAVLKFQKEDSEMALSVAFRNSYDRSMSLGIAIGATVFVCDNLALYGDIVVMRKHTKNVWNELENNAIAALYKSQRTYEEVVADSGIMKQQALGNEEAFRLMGILFGYGIVSPRQLSILKEQWLKPAYEDFQGRNMWSFFNATTESLKTCPPVTIMEKHAQAYKFLAKNVLPAKG
jgi:hypothetical protein